MSGAGLSGFIGWLMWTALLGSVGCALASTRERWRGRRLRNRARTLLGQRPRTPRIGGAWRRITTYGAASPARKTRHQRAREAAAALGVGAFVAVVAGGVTGLLLGGAAGCGVGWWMRRRAEGVAGTEEQEAARAAEQLPLAAELIAACLTAGSGPAQAADAVGRSLGGPLGIRLSRTAAELRLGAEPAAAWAHLTALPGSDGLVRSLERAGSAGVPAVEPMTRLTKDLRAQRTREASARARRAAVLVTGPLGLCFLPAFLAVGVAPVVLGLAKSLQ